MESQARNNTSQPTVQNGDENRIKETNVIRTCIEKHFETENFAKFQQLLDSFEPTFVHNVYAKYNSELMTYLQTLRNYEPFKGEGILMQKYITLKVKLYSFRIINVLGKYVIASLRQGNEKAEGWFMSLIKILLFHALTSKSDTANLALVEIEQLCLARKRPLQSLYSEFRGKFLRVIIKAVLHKLMTNGENDYANGNSNGDSSGNRPSWPSKSNRAIFYLTRALEVFNVTTITSDDVAKSLIITTNLIHKEKYNEAIKQFLTYLALYQNIDLCTLIRSHIQAIVISLLLKRKISTYDMSASLTKLCSFCEKTPSELLTTKFTFIKARLLLNYHIEPKMVTESLYYLTKFELKENEQPFEDEFEDEEKFVEYLEPSMIGILLGMDSHFTTVKQDMGSEECIKQIMSLGKLLSLLNENQVRNIHVKLLSTLSLLLRLRPKRDNKALNTAIRDLWSVFVSKLDKELKNSLVINICVALYDLVEDCPEEVSQIYTDLLFKQSITSLKEQLKSLFFIPNVPAMQSIYTFLTPYVRREDKVKNLQDLQLSLDCVLPLLAFENQKCRLLAVTKIKQLLQSNQNLLITNMLANLDEPLDTVISRTIESLIALTSTQDAECLALIAECLGILGAVNPIRMDHLIYRNMSDKQSVKFNHLSDPSFVADLIEKLKNSLFSDQKSESETANFALQVVVKNYAVFSDAKITRKLTGDALKACTLCRTTNYSGTKKVQPDLSIPVFEKCKQDNQYSYKEWIDKFASNIVSTVRDKKVRDVLYACSYVFKYNLKLAEHLLSNAIIHIILHQPTQVDIIKREVMAIVDEDVGVSTQDLDTVYTDDVRGNIQTLHFQCANMVFCALDTMHRMSCDALMKEPSMMRDLPVILNPRQLDSIKDFLNYVPKDKLAILASKCRSHARALCYFEQYLADNRHHLDKYSTALQRIYVALDDTFEAAGVEMVRTAPTTITDDISNYEACGRFDKAFICCETSLNFLDDHSEKDSCIEDALRCLSNQGDHQRLYEKSKQMMAEYSQYKRNILPYAIEATWNLGKWDELSSSFKGDQFDSYLDSASVSQGYLLTSLIESTGSVHERLKVVRHRLMKPLSIAMMDRSAYFRGYQHFLVLHSIGDFALSMDIFDSKLISTQESDENTLDNQLVTLNRKLHALLELWNSRNKLVQPSVRSLEPLLVWQRSISLVLAKKYPFFKEKLHIDVGSMWLRSADSAREARSFDRSFYCMTQAQRWFGSKFDQLSMNLRVRYQIEQAKLNWDQGEQTKAIRGLKLSIERLKNHKIYKHLVSRREKNLNSDSFPQLDASQKCSECLSIDQSERESFAQLKILLTQYCEEAAAGLPETLFFMYEECVHLGVNQEETYLRLARYYDKLLAYYMDNPTLCGEQAEEKNQFESTQIFSQNLISGDKDEVYTKLMQQSIIAFGNSLKYGVRYISESMPRLLNIWYDLGSKKPKASIPQPPRSREISSRIESTIRFIDELKTTLPPYYFMPAISLLLSRVCHPHSGVSKTTCEILELLLVNYPHQISWHMIALINETENDDRKRAAKQILASTKKRNLQAIDKIVNDTRDFSQVIIELCYNYSPQDKNRERRKKKLGSNYPLVKEVSQLAAKFDFDKCHVMVPIQTSMRAIIPINNNLSGENLQRHSVFPRQNVAYIKGFESRVKVFNSLQQPRCATVKCDNGKSVNLLCKSGDDLRKDSRCIEFLNLLNRILRRDNQSNARFFEIQTFLVLPLESHAGIIEMVPDLIPLKQVIEPLYKERKTQFSMHDYIPKKQDKCNANELYSVFMNLVLPKVSPPVLPIWFLRNFTEPTSWYMARLAYTRTCAVSSMGGYIIGLGDRHLDNILINTSNGRLVHVDFNLLFHQGENLPCPERVPFRLTQNFIAAMGPMGTEGNFRKVCEIAMRVMRKEKDSLLTTLKPFMHDPCSEWIKVRDFKERGKLLDQEDKHAENKSAKYRIEVVERKLKGFPRSKKFKPLTLIDSYSVEAQVDNLIEEAADTYNLSQMYWGWCPHL